MDALRIAQAQINPTVGDLDGNVAKISRAIERARKAHATVVMFPELAVCGYPPEDLLLKPGFLRDTREALAEVALQSKEIISVVGFADSVKGNVYNAAAVIENSRIVGIYHKMELPNYGVFDERRYFAPGSECRVFEACDSRIAVTICEDVWVEGGMAERCVLLNNAEVVLNLSASPFHAGKLVRRRDILRAFARRTKTFVCYTNLVGGQDELVFDGGSMVLSPKGQILTSAKRFEEYLLVTDMQGGVGPQAAELAPVQEVYTALVVGTRDYIRKNGFEKVVIGLSGGIDSSLTACIAVAAVGADNVIGVTMPSQYSSGETRSDAIFLAGNLNIGFMSVPIEPIFSSHVEGLSEVLGDGESGVEFENLQARIRGNTLMALSNKFGWLVLTTGNKSETAVGYCTLYGDTAGGFAVLKDVPKTLVYKLADYVNERAGREIIPGTVIERPPSAELKADQKDEDSLPPYAVLDPILRGYVEEDKSPDEIASEGFAIDLVRKVVQMVDRSEYKRRQAPPGVKITPKAFGRDRRLPITNRYLTRMLRPNCDGERSSHPGNSKRREFEGHRAGLRFGICHKPVTHSGRQHS